jgi:hypothetical protein
MIKQLLKKTLFRLAPETMTAIQSARARAHSHRLVKQWGLVELNNKLLERFGTVVLSGPFRGMTLTPMSYAEHLGPFLLGTYEAELHPWLEQIISQGHHHAEVLDIGAKFGYYAIGLARRIPGSRVWAFDTDRWARRATREMAATNQTPLVSVAGFCSPRWLNRHLLPGSFFLVDCEGYEGELFSGRTVTQALDTATVLVEIHDDLVPGVGKKVRERFSATHDVQSVTSSGGGTAARPDLPVDLSFLTPTEATSATHEVRGAQEWLLFTPRKRALLREEGIMSGSVGC